MISMGWKVEGLGRPAGGGGGGGGGQNSMGRRLCSIFLALREKLGGANRFFPDFFGPYPCNREKLLPRLLQVLNSYSSSMFMLIGVE